MPGHSTSHQLIELYHRILLALEAKQVTSVTFADISKAFDTVRVKALLTEGLHGRFSSPMEILFHVRIH
jgi:hypothetical protein